MFVGRHHPVPFTGMVHVAYLPGERILGPSKMARVVEMFARGLRRETLAECGGYFLSDGEVRDASP